MAWSPLAQGKNNLFGFLLTDDEVHRLEGLDLGHSQFIDHYAPEVAEMFVGARK